MWCKSVLVSTDIGPMARFEEVIADPQTPGMVFGKLTDGERLPGIAKEWRIPKGKFIQWFMTKHDELYDAALKVRAAELAMQALDEALEAKPEDVAVRRLRAEVALKLAAKFDRARYGESVRVEKSVSVAVDAGLLGAAGELLRLVVRGDRPVRQIEAETVTVEPMAEDI